MAANKSKRAIAKHEKKDKTGKQADRRKARREGRSR